MDQRLAYDRSGRGEPLVLLHPLGADRTVWEPVMALLEPQRDVICVDLPGFGESPPLNGATPPSPSRLSSPVMSLLRELGLNPAEIHLAGNSLGGWVALEAAASGQVASVTAIAPAGLWPEPLKPKPDLARRLARMALPLIGPATRSPALRRLILSASMAHPERVPPEQAAALVRSYLRASGSRTSTEPCAQGRSRCWRRSPSRSRWPGQSTTGSLPVREAPRPASARSPCAGVVTSPCGMTRRPSHAVLLDGKLAQRPAADQPLPRGSA